MSRGGRRSFLRKLGTTPALVGVFGRGGRDGRDERGQRGGGDEWGDRTGGAQQTAQFETGFSDGDLSAFETVAGSREDWSVVERIDGNSARVFREEGKSILALDPGEYSFEGPRRVGVDFEVSTRYWKRNGQIYVADGDQAWLARAGVQGDSVSLARRPADGTEGFSGVAKESVSIDDSAVHRLEVTVDEDSVAIALDGDRHLEYERSSALGAGTVGIANAGGIPRETWFDNLEVAAVDSDGGGDGNGGAEVPLELTVGGGTAEPGGTVDVAFRLENAGSEPVDRVSLDVGQPLHGWDREFVDDAGGSRLRVDTEGEPYVTGWLWESLRPGETVEPAYRLHVPDEATEGESELEAMASAPAATETSATATIRVGTDAGTLAFLEETTRLVQTVEDSRTAKPGLRDAVERPDMVAGRPTTVVFGLDGTDVEALPEDWSTTVEIERRRPDGSASHEFELPKPLVELIDLTDRLTGNVPALEFHEAPQANTPPVFDLSADVEEVVVRLRETEQTAGAETTLVRGEDFDVAETGTLDVGLIEIRAPASDTGIYGDGDGRLIAPVTDVETGTTVTDPREKVRVYGEEIRAYFRRTFPVADVSVHVFPGSLGGTTDGGRYQWDLTLANALLHTAFDGLDATIAVVPFGYFGYHLGENDFVGLEPTPEFEHTPNGTVVQDDSHPPAAAVFVERGDQKQAAVTAAQEIGHHFLGLRAYPNRLSMRDRDDGQTVLDNSHARTEDRLDDPYYLQSTAFDLQDGYAYLREGYADGYWARGRSSRDFGQDGSLQLGSFMSYGSDDVWADTHAYQAMIDDGLQPTPRVVDRSESAGGASGPGAGNAATGASAAFVGLARATDDGVDLLETTQAPVRPMGSAQSGATFRATGPDGADLTAVTVPTTTGGTHAHGADQESADVFVFGVPYPDRTTTFEVDHDGTTTSVNPHGRTLRDAISRVPDRGFVGDADRRRERLLALADDLTRELGDGDAAAAADTVSSLRNGVVSWVRGDYDRTADQPSRWDLLALVGDVERRLDAIREADDGLFGLGLPEWSPFAALAGGAALGYRYLTGSDDSGPDRPPAETTVETQTAEESTGRADRGPMDRRPESETLAETERESVDDGASVSEADAPAETDAPTEADATVETDSPSSGGSSSDGEQT